MSDRHLEAIADADPYPYWLDDVDEPISKPTLVKTESCDLCIASEVASVIRETPVTIARNTSVRASFRLHF